MSVEATRWAYTQTVGNPIGKAVLVALADRTDHKGECWFRDPKRSRIHVITGR